MELLLADPAALEGAGEPGLVALEAHLALDATTVVELLAHDGRGAPVLVLFCTGEEGAALGRIGRVVGTFRRVGGLLRVAFGQRGLDVSLPPRVLLLASRFSDEMADQLDLLGGIPVAALEYRVVRPRRGEPLLDVALFHRTEAGRTGAVRGGARRTVDARTVEARSGGAPPIAGGSLPGAGDRGPTRPARTQAPDPTVDLEGEPDELTDLELEPLSVDDLDELLDRAYQSIVSLSEQVSASDEGEHIRFLVDGRPLASLLRDEGAGTLTLTLDEEGGVLATLAIADELGLHAALNALFDRYFQELDAPL